MTIGDKTGQMMQYRKHNWKKTTFTRYSEAREMPLWVDYPKTTSCLCQHWKKIGESIKLDVLRLLLCEIPVALASDVRYD